MIWNCITILSSYIKYSLLCSSRCLMDCVPKNVHKSRLAVHHYFGIHPLSAPALVPTSQPTLSTVHGPQPGSKDGS